jgi:hypothetical protein
VRYSSGERQLRALYEALALATNIGDETRMRHFAEEVFIRIAQRPITSKQLVTAKHHAAAALVAMDDPRGDQLFEELEQLPAELAPPELGLGFRRSWLFALESVGRCDDAAVVLAKLDDYVARHSLIDDEFREWRITLVATAHCKRAFLHPLNRSHD